MYSNQKDSSHHKKCTCWVARAFPLTSTWYHRTNIRCPHVQTYCVPSRVTLEKLTRHVPPAAESQSNPCLLPRRKSPCGSDANRFNENLQRRKSLKSVPFFDFCFQKTSISTMSHKSEYGKLFCFRIYFFLTLGSRGEDEKGRSLWLPPRSRTIIHHAAEILQTIILNGNLFHQGLVLLPSLVS